MKRQMLLVASLIMLVCVVAILPSSVKAYNPFDQVVSGDHLYWEVVDYNETNNLVEPAEWWRMSDFSFQGEYVLHIGDVISFTLGNPTLGDGALDIGNLSLSTVTRADFGFNLNLFTGPAFPPYQNNSFAPGLVASTNWSAQIEAATKTAIELRGNLMIQTLYQQFLQEDRAVIAFYYTQGDQITNAIYDNETGLLLYCYTKFQLSWMGFRITLLSSEIPAYGILVTISALFCLTLIAIVKRKSISLRNRL